MARPQAFERELRLAGAGLAPDVLRKQLAAFAKQELAKAQAAGEAPEHYVRAVNGRIGAPEESVELPGPIVYSFNVLPDVAEYALAFAKERSPVKSGRFKKSWFVMVNGRQMTNFESIPLDGEVIVTNDQPYSRKIETGHMTMSVPPGIVEDVRQSVLRRFGNIVTVEKRFISLAGAYILKTSGRAQTAAQDRRSSAFRAGRTHLAGRKDTKAGQELRYPAAVIRLRF